MCLNCKCVIISLCKPCIYNNDYLLVNIVCIANKPLMVYMLFKLLFIDEM